MKEKRVSILYFIASFCFFTCAVINFISSNSSMTVIYLCLGSTYLCLGSIYLNKSNKN